MGVRGSRTFQRREYRPQRRQRRHRPLAGALPQRIRGGQGRDPEPKPQGHFGANSNGLHDVGGNVWEWTTTCYRRVALDKNGRVDTRTDNCGVRVVAGKHRGYMSFFIRDGKSGGCAAGLPPDNLGIRLVRERPSMLSAFKALWRGATG